MSNKYFYNDGLESSRLFTRFLTLEDIEIWTEFMKDEESIQFIPVFEVLDVHGKTKAWIERQMFRYSEKICGLQALIHKETNDFIGQCGLLTQEVNGKIEIEVGYHIFKQYRGQGFATEAAKLFIDFAFNNNLTNSVISIIDIRNLKSQRVAEKNSLNKERKTTWGNLEVLIYRIEK